MPITNGNSVNGVLEANVVGQNYAVPYSMLSDISSQLIDLSNAVTDLSGVVTDLSGSFTDLSGFIHGFVRFILQTFRVHSQISRFICRSLRFICRSLWFIHRFVGFIYRPFRIIHRFVGFFCRPFRIIHRFVGFICRFIWFIHRFVRFFLQTFQVLLQIFQELSRLSNTVVVDICNQLVIIDNSINILEGDLFEASYNELYLKKPNPVIDLSGSYNSTDTRIELEWALPPRYVLLIILHLEHIRLSLRRYFL